MNVVAYVLCDRFGETLVIEAQVERGAALRLHEQGWRVYRGIAG